MQIKFYVTVSEHNKLLKELSSELSLECTLRESASILSPSVQVTGGIGLAQYNYAYIPSFNRYYFITDIVSVKNNLWEVSLEVDPLMSWADELKTVTAIAVRNENAFNLYLPDPEFSNDARSLIQYREIGKFQGFTTIITVMGGDPTG